MGVTSVLVNGLQIHDGVKYAVSADTLPLLEGMSPNQPIMVEMANRYPAYVRQQPQARPVTLVVYLIRPNALDRKTDFDVLKTALDTSTGLATLTWVDTTGPTVTKTLKVHCASLTPANWMARASAELIAPNPEPTVS